MRHFLTLLMLLFIGCASAPCDSEKINVHEVVGKIANVTVLATRDTNKKEVALILEAAKEHINAFQSDFKEAIRPTTVFVFRGPTVSCDQDSTRRFAGCYRTRTNKILVILGAKYELPALYHEFVHRTLRGHDVYHESPKWRATWTPRCNEIARKLRRRRRNLDTHRVYWGID
jgi:hypothetical protein